MSSRLNKLYIFNQYILSFFVGNHTIIPTFFFFFFFANSKQSWYAFHSYFADDLVTTYTRDVKHSARGPKMAR